MQDNTVRLPEPGDKISPRPDVDEMIYGEIFDFPVSDR